MSSQSQKALRLKPDLTARPTALLYTLIAAKAVTVGELVDFANAIPQEWLGAVAETLALSVMDDYRSGRRPAARRRRLIILGALTTRLAFDIEGVPRSRLAKI